MVFENYDICSVCECLPVNVFRNALSQNNTLKIEVANRLQGQKREFQGYITCADFGW